ncbi:MAG: DUF4956 domain-containing protein [Acidobacteria bacterium]|nr:DUF4956 domain-containing protein [Acidobacteriota bacterium]
MDAFTQLIEGTGPQAVEATISSLVLSMLLAFVLGQFIAWVYGWTHSGLSYSRSFTQSLVLITMLVSLVMFVIGNSLITAFGLLGALAIIRFRNVLKDTRDTVFVFLALVLGMAVGTQRYVTAIFGTCGLMLVVAYLSYTNFGSFGRFDGYLSLRLASGSDAGPVLHRFCRTTKQVSVRHNGSDGIAEYVYQVGLRDRTLGQQLLAELRAIQGVDEVSLVLRDELAEV